MSLGHIRAKKGTKQHQTVDSVIGHTPTYPKRWTPISFQYRSQEMWTRCPVIVVLYVLVLVSTGVHDVTVLSRVVLAGHNTPPPLPHSTGDDFLQDSQHRAPAGVARTWCGPVWPLNARVCAHADPLALFQTVNEIITHKNWLSDQSAGAKHRHNCITV